MVQVLTPDATTSYTYDGLGNRLQRNHNGDITRFVHSGDNVIATADATNTIDQYFIYGLGLEAMIVGSDTYTYHFNGIGSTVAMTDNTENIVNQYAYEAFGKISNENELVDQPFAYVGQYGVQQEPNALYFMRARYYDSNVGRFIKEDPIGLAGGDSVYAYVMNNPTGFVDPEGYSRLAAGWVLISIAGKWVWKLCKPSAKVAKKKIGDVLSREERALLKDIFKGDQDLSKLSKAKREAAAKIFDQTAKLPGQHEAGIAFNKARSAFLRGNGPNPGPSAIDFAIKNGIPLPGKGGS